MTTKAIAQINNVNILIIEGGEKRVPIKPICEALGVAYQPQFSKIKQDEILGPVMALRATTGRDGKKRKMATIPYMYVFGWLFSINPKNVREEAREKVIEYKLACYDAYYDYLPNRLKGIGEHISEN